MTKVKHFLGYDGSELENEINEFISNNQGIVIRDIKYSHVTDLPDMHYDDLFTALLIYEEQYGF